MHSPGNSFTEDAGQREMQKLAGPKAVHTHPHRTLAKCSARKAPEFIKPKEALK